MTPRWTLAVIAGLAALAAATMLYWTGRHAGATRERAKVEAARAEATVAGLEAQGARDSVKRIETAVHQREAAARTVAEVSQQAVRSEDADVPLDEDRAARLRAADRRLCELAPGSCAQDRDAG